MNIKNNNLILYQSNINNPDYTNNFHAAKDKANSIIQDYFDSITPTKKALLTSSREKALLTFSEKVRNRKTNTTIKKNINIRSGQYIISDIKYYYNNNNEITLQFFYFFKEHRNIKALQNSYQSFNIKDSALANKNSNFSVETDKDSKLWNYNNLSIVLQKIYSCKVNIIINKVHYPYINADILCKYLAFNANRNNFIHIWKSIANNPALGRNNLNSFLVGIKIIINGRLITESVIPRKTSKSVVIGTLRPRNIFGSSADNNIITNIDKAKINFKNKIGAFTIHAEICTVRNNSEVVLRLLNYSA